MGNSTIFLQSVVDYAKTLPELQPQLGIGAYLQQPALRIANDVIRKWLALPYPPKWNRFKLPVFYTNSFQQDYAIPGLLNLAWLEHGVAIDINNTSLPKPIWNLECVRDLEVTAVQYGTPGQASSLPNDQLTYGIWAATTTFGQLLNVPSSSASAISQVQDAFGNLWVVTNNLNATVITGSSNPFSSNLNPVFPTANNPNITATTVNDGTVVWTAVNPKGQGIRLNPIPPQTGVVYQINLFGQKIAPTFTSLQQTIEPVPDNEADHFIRGFTAHCYMHSKDPEVRAKFQDFYNLWMQSLEDARRQYDREKDNTGLVPSEGIMTNPYIQYPGAANPYWPGGY